MLDIMAVKAILAIILVLGISRVRGMVPETKRSPVRQQQVHLGQEVINDNYPLFEIDDESSTSNRHGGRQTKFCQTSDYRKFTLKRVKEAPFSGLFRDLKNQTTFEGSDIAELNGNYYVVFDSSMSLGMLDEKFQFRGDGQRLIGERGQESQFEGIAHVPENDTWLLLAESIPTEMDGIYKPEITVGKLHDDLDGYDIVERCIVDFELTHENKGFEAIAYVNNMLLGLCEGNYCVGGEQGKEPGNGRIVVSSLQRKDDGTCVWEPVSVIDIPRDAYFQDYSGMAIHSNLQKIAILSQEDAAIYVADFDVENLSFKEGTGAIYHLPRDTHCNKVYCNAEGVQFLDEYRLIIVSDKAKKDQPFQCDDKDQSVHIFAFPAGWNPYDT